MPDWLWLCILLLTNGALIYAGTLRYEHGIWDGAFNQFLPQVQAAMRKYDAHRAEQILGPVSE